MNAKLTYLVAYYCTLPNKLPLNQPSRNVTWYDMVVSIHEERGRSTRTRPALKRVLSGDVAAASTMMPPPSKRGRSIVTNTPVVATPPTQIAVTPPEATRHRHDSVIWTDTYWESPEAIRLFCTSTNIENDSALPVVQKRIERFQRGFTQPDGWKLVLDDFDQNNLCTSFDIFNIQMKCRYVVMALRLAEKEMPRLTWKQCCHRAVEQVNGFEGHQYIRNLETVRIWHHTIRESNDCFPNPQIVRRGAAPRLPPLLENNPDLKEGLLKHAKENLNDLSGEMMFTYLHEVALPTLIENRRQELEDNDITLEDVLKENQLTKLTLNTVYRYMERLDFKYEPRKKCYYVDGHEKPETIAYREKYVKRYLKTEFRMYRWIQLPKNEVEEMKENGEMTDDMRFSYHDDLTNMDMVEFHVDNHPIFLDRVSSIEFGGHLSVRKPADQKPLLTFGQDECIFKQFSFTPKAWTLPNGQKAVIPKDEGAGIMISGFVSREFGFGMEIAHGDLEKVNRK